MKFPAAFSWEPIVLAVLKLVLAYASQARWREGYDQAIAEVTQAILAKTAAGKKIMDEVNAMSDAEIDRGLRDLEPK